MQNMKDKRNIILIIMILIIGIGILFLVRGCNHNEVEENPSNNQETPVVEPDDKDVVEEDTTQSESSNQYYVSNPILEETTDYEEEELYPKVELDTISYTVALGEKFSLPEIPAFDKNGNPLTVIGISYKFCELYDSEFISTVGFSTERVGTYMITYYVENEKHYVSEVVIYVEIIDDVAPTIIGKIEKINLEAEDGIEFIVVESESKINQDIHFEFSDNDEIVYAYYYNESEDNSIEGDTIEQDAMPNIIPIDFTSDFILSATNEEGENQEGKYYIRVYDRSWNVSEFVVIFDFTPPEVEEITYQQESDESGDFVQVTITFDEEVQLDEVLLEAGWEISEDSKTITKLYEVHEGSIEDVIIVTDLAGNTILEPISIEYEIQTDEESPGEEETESGKENEMLEVYILQNDMITQSEILNTYDGEIKLQVNKEENIEITYKLNGGESISYESGTILTEVGDYQFTITDGNEVIEIQFSICSLDITN